MSNDNKYVPPVPGVAWWNRFPDGDKGWYLSNPNLSAAFIPSTVHFHVDGGAAQVHIMVECRMDEAGDLVLTELGIDQLTTTRAQIETVAKARIRDFAAAVDAAHALLCDERGINSGNPVHADVALADAYNQVAKEWGIE